ncbi:hypothetical protein VNO77_17668 [Canavalia gladiata]|uniref:2-amino-4-hydroxy-6-hydroxymethyldihydropteridine diphosphokinase n=1 Tax=Canavalia gladiata TaxID=3824 RepID=A0AAN9LJH2_CANGL
MSTPKYLGAGRHQLFAARKYLKVPGFTPLHTAPNSSVELQSHDEEAVIALGSNVGNRLHNFKEAMKLMRKSGINITRLLVCMRQHQHIIEKDLGRTDGIRYGPRSIDLDILFYGKYKVRSDILTIPHERIWERPFVMAPLMDLQGSAIDSDTVATWHSFSGHSGGFSGLWEKLGGESLIGEEGMYRVMPIANGLLDWSRRTSVMGILNLTPDSFSDGLRISVEEELSRLIPVLEAVVSMPEVEGKLISVLDSNMFKLMADLDLPYVAMHMRGDPCTMQNSENRKYDNVCKEISLELYSHVREAEMSGILAWRIIIDPGLGFSKKTEDNLDVLTGLPDIREEIAKRSLAISHAPILIGPSRKRFLGEICSRPNAVERDPAIIASVAAGVLGGANIVRVHNVKDNLDAVKFCDCNNSITGVLCHRLLLLQGHAEPQNAAKSRTKKYEMQ